MDKMIRNRLADYIPKQQYRYYYASFTDVMQTAYDKLLQGYLNQKTKIVIKVSCLQEAWTIHEAIRYDVPELFFIKSVSGSYDPQHSSANIYPEYRFDPEICHNILWQMEALTKPLIQRIKDLPEQEKVRQIHDFLVKGVTYKDSKAPYSHEAPGTIVYGIGVCEGIAKAFKYLSDRAGLRSILLVGKSVDDGIASPDDVYHAWNIVYVDSCPYHMDVTFDYSVSSGSPIRYDYYLLSDSQIKKDHSFTGFPECTKSFEFYAWTGHYVNSKKVLQTLIQKELEPGKPLVVKTPDFAEDTDRVVKKLLETAADSVSLLYSLSSVVSMSYNDSRMIFQFELCPRS